MAVRGTVDLALHGVDLRLECESAPFSAYVRRAMEPLLCDAGTPRVVSRLHWRDGRPSRDLAQAFGVKTWERRVDRDLYLAGNRAYWLRIDDFEDLQIVCTWSSDRLEIDGYYHFALARSKLGDRVRRFMYRSSLDHMRARRFSTLLYYLVYHPILWFLSREHGWHALHAAGVAFGDRALVLAGLPGCGKSTLAVAMAADPDVSVMSDNLLLCDGQRVRACPELLLLDPQSLARVGRARDRLTAVGERRVYGRDAYRPDRILLGAYDPTAVVHVGQAQHHGDRVVSVSSAVSADRLSAANWMAKEVRRHAIMSRVIDRVAGAVAPDEAAVWQRLADSVPSYELWMTPAADLGDVARTLRMRTEEPARAHPAERSG